MKIPVLSEEDFAREALAVGTEVVFGVWSAPLTHSQLYRVRLLRQNPLTERNFCVGYLEGRPRRLLRLFARILVERAALPAGG